MGGYPVAWIDMPVVEPLTAENFLLQFHHVAASQAAQQFKPQCPTLNDTQVISVTPQASPIQGGSSALIRAVFAEQGAPGEGLFLLTVGPFMPYMGGPGGGNAFGLMFTGITAPSMSFTSLKRCWRR